MTLIHSQRHSTDYSFNHRDVSLRYSLIVTPTQEGSYVVSCEVYPDFIKKYNFNKKDVNAGFRFAEPEEVNKVSRMYIETYEDMLREIINKRSLGHQLISVSKLVLACILSLSFTGCKSEDIKAHATYRPSTGEVYLKSSNHAWILSPEVVDDFCEQYEEKVLNAL